MRGAVSAGVAAALLFGAAAMTPAWGQDAAPAVPDAPPAPSAPVTATIPAAVPTKGAESAAPSPVSAPEAAPAASAPKTNVPDDYRLDTDDTIVVDVARHSDVSRTLRIPADGSVRLVRLTHPIPARGHTCAQLADLIAARLETEGRLVIRPGQVTVAVTTPRARRVYVRGSAIGGREHDLQNGERISELVAAIGGVPQPDRVTAVLTGPHRPDPIRVNLDDALNVPGSADNVPLLEGDTLTIDAPRRIRLYVEGEGPRGLHEFDYRFGLKQMLVEMGVAAQNATGDLRRCRIRRKSDPRDPTSPDTFVPVDLLRVMQDDSYDIRIQDMDTLEIPVSQQFIYVFGEVGGPRKVYLPQDRTWYLSDVIANGGGTYGSAKIGAVSVIRETDGKPVAKKYDFGKYLKDLDTQQNPAIQAGDLVYVPTQKRPDTGSIWTVFGLFNLVRSIFPAIPGSL